MCLYYLTIPNKARALKEDNRELMGQYEALAMEHGNAVPAWMPWYALFPVRLVDGRRVWLKQVWRRANPYLEYGSGYWIYWVSPEKPEW